MGIIFIGVYPQPLISLAQKLLPASGCGALPARLENASRLSSKLRNMNHALPGEDLIEAGLKDLREGRESIAALLVRDRIASTAPAGSGSA